MAEKAEAPLDDLMMAMDVVDTLRHDEVLVQKELSADTRDEGMIKRLKDLYAAQGIDVPDHILQAGVEGLKQDRFVYAPPASGFSRSLALLYVTRGSWSKWLAGLLVAAIIGIAGWQFLVVAPRERAAEALRIELTQDLPARLAELSDRVKGLTDNQALQTRADTLRADGLSAAADGKAEAARKAASDLQALAATLAQSYDVQIVSRPGTPTGVTRIPDANRNAKNYYLVVEGIDADGKAVPLPVVSEEDGKSELVTIWAQRVSKAVFDRVRRDKEDDGIVQQTRLGTKKRGETDIDWISGVETGAITKW
ncbi:DUF6384 family protein [Roseibium sp.]|uniref:DUF6384 family protein n=1 Tax=Roseibium sp. TaxID=1936156 RepID=UPI003A968E04